MEIKPKTIRTRFAPSPTGFVHIGSLRTALFSFLFARHEKGTHVLRIEDTDQTRLVEGAVENLIKVMKTVGVEFDEGYYVDDKNELKEKGEFGPYLQSKRLPLYQKYAKQLIEQKNAYFCFCSQKRLEELKKEQIALKKPPMYDRLCRKLSEDEVKAKLEEFTKLGKNPVIRQAIPEQGQTVVHDLIYGDIVYDHKILDDQVILKSDGYPTYHLAVVVDDHEMKITHVIRGEEWIPSTPKHLLLYKFLNWEPTAFAHLPLILNKDKTKLSKRQGDVAVEDFINNGYLPEALINFVALLGWNPKTEQEIFSLQELIEQFDLVKVNKAPAVFDVNKLDWLNGQYIKKKSAKDLVDLLIPFWEKEGINIKQFKVEYFQAIANLEKERLNKLSEIGDRTGYFFKKPNYDPTLIVWKKSDLADAKEKLNALKEFLSEIPENEFKKEILEKKIFNFIEINNFDKGSVLWPLRVALTGLEKSPGPFEVAEVLAIGLGKEEILERISNAVAK